MKRILSFVLCLFLLTSCALAEAPFRVLTEEDPAYAWLYEKSMTMAGLFNEALHNEAYVSLLMSSDQFADELSALRVQDYTLPVSVTLVRADDAFLEAFAGGLQDTLNSLALSDGLEAMVRRTAVLSLPNTLIGATASTNTLALSSALAFADAYACPEEIDSPYYYAVMMYGGLYAFLVAFVPGGNGAVTVRAQVIPARAVDLMNLPAE